MSSTRSAVGGISSHRARCNRGLAPGDGAVAPAGQRQQAESRSPHRSGTGDRPAGTGPGARARVCWRADTLTSVVLQQLVLRTRVDVGVNQPVARGPGVLVWRRGFSFLRPLLRGCFLDVFSSGVLFLAAVSWRQPLALFGRLWPGFLCGLAACLFVRGSPAGLSGVPGDWHDGSAAGSSVSAQQASRLPFVPAGGDGWRGGRCGSGRRVGCVVRSICGSAMRLSFAVSVALPAGTPAVEYIMPGPRRGGNPAPAGDRCLQPRSGLSEGYSACGDGGQYGSSRD